MFFVTLTTPMQKIAKSNESKLFPNGRITENIDGFINTPHYVNRHNIHLFKIISQINITTFKSDLSGKNQSRYFQGFVNLADLHIYCSVFTLILVVLSVFRKNASGRSYTNFKF